MLLDAVTWVTILLPLGLYAIWVGVKSSSRRPTAVWGPTDLFAMGLGLGGLAVTGPFGLFFPQAAFNFLGERVWFAIAALCLLVLVLAIGYTKPRIVIYAAQGCELQKTLRGAIEAMGLDAKWAGDAFDCGEGGLRGRLEQRSGSPTAEIICHGDADPRIWRRLHVQLERQFAETVPNRRALNGWSAAGLACLAVAAALIWQHPAAHAEAIAGLIGGS